MINSNKSNATKTQSQKQAAVITENTVKPKTIKLGIDVHLDRHVVVRIVDGGTPQPPQRFEPAEFLLWVAKQITLAEKVFTCYEAGPFGYSLHRKLEKMGTTNYVVRPRKGFFGAPICNRLKMHESSRDYPRAEHSHRAKADFNSALRSLLQQAQARI